MDPRETQEKNSETKGGAFFYEQWKRMQSTPGTPARELAGHSTWSQALPADRQLRAVAVDPAETAKKSLDRYKQRLQEYREVQSALLHLQTQDAEATTPEEKSRAQQGLKILEGRLDFLERELRHGYSRTKSAMQELRKAS